MRYMIGSTLLGIENNKDVDMIELDDTIFYKREVKEGIDLIKTSTKRLKELMQFKADYNNNYWFLLVNYQLDTKIIGEDFPIKYSILEYKTNLIKLLEMIIEDKLCNFNPLITIDGKYCTKKIYHIAYNLFILYNNDVKLTIDQHEVIQRIHDGDMPIEYLEYLKELLQKVKEANK